ncbi:nucleoside triphosphate pyrophosphohydrolase [Acetobacter orleanensis]|nr:nucleoside triphosphate pyrophosphohydrolase [Acetobacter orleanensis]KXV66912.1 nucleotide pyrophosphohydrolase [Acetobacter orleanensis]PCD78370.1 nucleoside triphosphate pyrophosphohydrolase [Acetobacter orleanensis]
MARLRDPEHGCPWDREQTHETIAPYAIEEAYEVLDAIQKQDWQAFPDELGDLLLQVVYQARLAEEEGYFDFATVARLITEKMIRRHPHVTFGPDVLGSVPLDASLAKNRETGTVSDSSPTLSDPRSSGYAASGPSAYTAMPGQWERLKEKERQKLRAPGEQSSALAGIPPALPALLRASKIASRAARVGFDWPDVQGVVAKVHEEMEEFAVEMQANDRAKMQDELGDVFFSLASLARRLDLDPEACLRQACDKFTRRFQAVEAELAAEGRSMLDEPVAYLDDVWNRVKKRDG